MSLFFFFVYDDYHEEAASTTPRVRVKFGDKQVPANAAGVHAKSGDKNKTNLRYNFGFDDIGYNGDK